MGALRGQVAAGPAGHGQPRAVEGRVDAPLAIRGQGGRPGEQRDAAVDQDRTPAGRLAVDVGEEGRAVLHAEHRGGQVMEVVGQALRPGEVGGHDTRVEVGRIRIGGSNRDAGHRRGLVGVRGQGIARKFSNAERR